MFRTRTRWFVSMLVGAAFVAAAAYRPVFAASQARGMSGMPMSHDSMSIAGGKAVGHPPGGISGLITGAQHITVYVLPGSSGLGFTGPDGAHHDTMVPSSFVLRRGVPVTITVINLDDMRHSITALALGVNIIVKPAADRRNGAVVPSTTTYTFIPDKAGEFRWFCEFPCDMPQHWAMSPGYDGPDRDGFMAGIIRVLG